MESEKIYCQTCDPLSVAALMNNKGGNEALTAMLANGNNINNSPWMYLIFLAIFGGNGLWGNRGDNSNVNTRLSELSNQMADNHNNDIALQAINGNASAIRELSTILNTDFSSMQTAICGVKSAIEQVSGQVGYSAESVKNAIAIGDANIIQQMQNCCCQNKQLVQQMGYEGQLRDQANTSAIMERISTLANGVQQGFSQIGFQSQQNTQAIISNQDRNTQAILDKMCASETQNLRDLLAAKDRELMVAQLKGSCGCGCN